MQLENVTSVELGMSYTRVIVVSNNCNIRYQVYTYSVWALSNDGEVKRSVNAYTCPFSSVNNAHIPVLNIYISWSCINVVKSCCYCC